MIGCAGTTYPLGAGNAARQETKPSIWPALTDPEVLVSVAAPEIDVSCAVRDIRIDVSFQAWVCAQLPAIAAAAARFAEQVAEQLTA